MDWSRIYEDAGGSEESAPLRAPMRLPVRAVHYQEMEIGETRSSRVAHRLLTISRSFSMEGLTDAVLENQYSPFVAYSFTVNYILGVGSLGIPYAIYHSGIILGNALVLCISFLSLVTVMWVCECSHRVREMDMRNEHSKLLKDPNNFPEVTQLCQRFLGKYGARMYQISLVGLMYGGLIGYSQVFVNSLMSQIAYVGAVKITSMHAAGCFALVVVPLSCCDLTEQIGVQVFMSIVRFFALTIMFFSATTAIFLDPYDGGNSVAINTTAPYISEVPLVNFNSFGLIFSTAVFSQVSLI